MNATLIFLPYSVTLTSQDAGGGWNAAMYIYKLQLKSPLLHRHLVSYRWTEKVNNVLSFWLILWACEREYEFNLKSRHSFSSGTKNTKLISQVGGGRWKGGTSWTLHPGWICPWSWLLEAFEPKGVREQCCFLGRNEAAPGTEAEKRSRCLGCRSSTSSAGTTLCLGLEAVPGSAARVSSQGPEDGHSLRVRPKQGAEKFTAKYLPNAGSKRWVFLSAAKPETLKMASCPFSSFIHIFSLLTISPPPSPVPNKSP